MNKFTPVNDNVVIVDVELEKKSLLLMPDDSCSGKQWEKRMYNIEVGQVVESDKFAKGSKIFFSRGLSEPIDGKYSCIKTYRVWGYYEEGI